MCLYTLGLARATASSKMQVQESLYGLYTGARGSCTHKTDTHLTRSLHCAVARTHLSYISRSINTRSQTGVSMRRRQLVVHTSRTPSVELSEPSRGTRQPPPGPSEEIFLGRHGRARRGRRSTARLSHTTRGGRNVRRAHAVAWRELRAGCQRKEPSWGAMPGRGAGKGRRRGRLLVHDDPTGGGANVGAADAAARCGGGRCRA